MTTWAEIIEDDRYEYYGVRWVEDELAVGQVAPVSRVWVDGSPTDDPLAGACAIRVRTADDIERVLSAGSIYFGAPVLLGSMEMEYGEDDGEIVMRQAVVLGL